MRGAIGSAHGKPRIVIADDFVGLFADLSELDALRQLGEVVRHTDRPADERALASRLAGARVAITVRAAFTRFPEGAPHVAARSPADRRGRHQRPASRGCRARRTRCLAKATLGGIR